MIKSIAKKCCVVFVGVLLTILGIFGVACQNSASNNSNPNVTYVLNQPVVELGVGETFSLSVLSSDNKTVKASFSSAMPEIASVEENGTITANKIGETKIIAMVNGQQLSCIVRVEIKLQAVPELLLQGIKKTDGNYTLRLIKGTEYEVIPVLSANGETLPVQITAVSENAQSVKVENNVITAQAVAQNVKVTFTCIYENETYEAVCLVSVEEVAQQ